MSVSTAAVPILAGPAASGLILTAAEFDAAEGEPGWRYELIRGVVVVSPAPLPQERSPNDLLGYWLLDYQHVHPQGGNLDDTLQEHDIFIGDGRRRADRVVWAGLGRQPRVDETPTIAIEFVSAGKQNWLRDYVAKRDEYQSVGIDEYWVINRFDRTLTVFKSGAAERVIKESDVYSTDILPGFELNLSKLLAAADRWSTT